MFVTRDFGGLTRALSSFGKFVIGLEIPRP